LAIAVSSCDGRDRRIEIEGDFDPLAERAAQQLGDLLDLLVDLDARRAQRLASRKGQKPSRQLGAVERRGQRLVDQLLLVGVQRAAVAQQVEIADDDAEVIVEIMRQPAGQLPERFHLLRLVQQRFGFLPLGYFRFELDGTLAHALFQALRVIVEQRFCGGEPAVQPAGFDQQHTEHKARRQEAVGSTRVKAEIEARGIKHRAEPDIEHPGKGDDDQPQIEHGMRPLAP
jgi:hypothetical protein